jgi:hypothetical protein
MWPEEFYEIFEIAERSEQAMQQHQRLALTFLDKPKLVLFF